MSQGESQRKRRHAIRNRLDLLARKANEGQLTAQEQREYDRLIELSDCIAVQQLRTERREEELRHKSRRIVPAPASSDPRFRSTVLDVECAEDEEVVWHYTETLEGRFVSGYSIVPRATDRTSELIAQAIAEAKGEARENGLTDENLDAELEGWQASQK